MTEERTDEPTAKDLDYPARSYVEVEEQMDHPELPAWITLKPKLRKYREHPIADAVGQAKVRVVNEKIIRCQNFAKEKGNSVPVSFRENTNKEKLILEHVKKYGEQFAIAYKDNRYPLFTKEALPVPQE